MLVVSVKANLDDALRFFDVTREEGIKATVRALNKTITSARARAARQIVDTGYGLKIATIKKQLTIRRATKAELSAMLNASGRPIPLINYGARTNNKGVSVAVLYGRKQIDGAFIATMPSGHKGVFVRTGTAAEKSARKAGMTTGTQKHGLPIRELFGPSIPSAFLNSKVQQALQEAVRSRFGVVLQQELNFIALH